MEVYWIGLKDSKQELKVINNRKYIESEISKAGEVKKADRWIVRHLDLIKQRLRPSPLGTCYICGKIT